MKRARVYIAAAVIVWFAAGYGCGKAGNEAAGKKEPGASKDQTAQAPKALDAKDKEIADLKEQIRVNQVELAKLNQALAEVSAKNAKLTKDIADLRIAAGPTPPKPGPAPKAAPAKTVKTYTSVNAILADIPAPPMPLAREWNEVTLGRLRDWIAAVNDAAKKEIPGNVFSARATLASTQEDGGTLYVLLTVPGSASYKGCLIETPLVNLLVRVNATSVEADDLRNARVGEICTFTGKLASVTLDGAYVLPNIRGVALTFDKGVELSKFTTNPALKVKME